MTVRPVMGAMPVTSKLGRNGGNSGMVTVELEVLKMVRQPWTLPVPGSFTVVQVLAPMYSRLLAVCIFVWRPSVIETGAETASVVALMACKAPPVGHPAGGVGPVP